MKGISRFSGIVLNVYIANVHVSNRLYKPFNNAINFNVPRSGILDFWELAI